MVTERVITLPTEPTEGKIVKSHPLFSFINIGQRGRINSNQSCVWSSWQYFVCKCVQGLSVYDCN